MEEDFLFSLQTYTPNSDLATGFKPNQVVYSRSGNDTLLGYQPLIPNLDLPQIDLLAGDLAIEDPAFREWNDTFVLGDWSKPYYANGDANNFGVNDFALIADFNSSQDSIQLYGTPNNYQVVNVGVGSALVQQQSAGADVVGFVLGGSSLDLGSNYFNFQGSTPPPGPVIEQTQQLGTPGFDIAATTTTDTFGNVYVAGGTTGSFPGAENNAESRDALITKYDNQGNQLWTKQFGSSEFDTIYGVKSDSQGDVYVAGTTEGNLGATKQAQGADAWVAKYDGNGNQEWVQQFGSDLINSAFAIDVDDNSNVYLSGITVRSAPEVATDDFWVTKYDTNGSRQWFTEFGSSGSAFDEPYAVAVSNDGSVYTGGWTLGDFAGENAGLYDAALAKLNNNGEVEWLRQLGTPDYEWTWGVDTDSQGNLYATGWTLGDLGGENAGSYDAWLTKYDSAGNQQWLKQFGSPGDDQPFDMTIDSQNNIFITGYTDGDLGGENAGSFDAWVAKYDLEGNQTWIQQFGTPDFDQAYSITTDSAGNLYFVGVTDGSLGDVNAGSFDAWIAKLDAELGTLQNFNGTVNLDSDSFMPEFSFSDLGESVDPEMVSFLSGYFEEFLSSTGIGLDGSGITNLAQNPYHQSTPVPEPSSVLGILIFAAFAGIGAMLKARRKSSFN